MDQFVKTVTKIGNFLLNPIKIISNTNIPDKFFAFMSKHGWIKILVSFLIMLAFIIVYYVIKKNAPVEIP